MSQQYIFLWVPSFYTPTFSKHLVHLPLLQTLSLKCVKSKYSYPGWSVNKGLV